MRLIQDITPGRPRRITVRGESFEYDLAYSPFTNTWQVVPF